MTGAVGVSVTVIDAVPVLPPDCALSVAVTVMVFAPTLSGTFAADQVLPVTVAATPFTVTEAMPESVSLAVPVTVMVGALLVAPFAGVVIVTTGLTASCVEETTLLSPEFVVPSVAVARK